jgi:hypothetical protein
MAGFPNDKKHKLIFWNILFNIFATEKKILKKISQFSVIGFNLCVLNFLNLIHWKKLI